MLDASRRKDVILSDAKNLAFAQGLELVEDPALLDEVAGLVEWPVVLMGSFDTSFLAIPQEVIRAGDFDIIGAPLDFLGINYYTRIFASASGDKRPPGVHGFTDMDWEVYPEGLTELLTKLNAEYKLPPIFITENGCANPDRPTAD